VMRGWGIDDAIIRGGKVRRDGGGESGMGDDMALGMVVGFVVVGGRKVARGIELELYIFLWGYVHAYNLHFCAFYLIVSDVQAQFFSSLYLFPMHTETCGR
jgi:hypothetical protein